MTSAQQRQGANQVRQNRQVLFDEASLKQRRRNNKPNNSHVNNATAAEAASIQNSLSRTQHLLSHELNRVSAVSSTIDADGKALEETMKTHQTLSVKKAKHALTALQRAQQREQRVLTASILFFWSVVVYILFVRVVMHIPFVDRLLASISTKFVEILKLISNIL